MLDSLQWIVPVWCFAYRWWVFILNSILMNTRVTKKVQIFVLAFRRRMSASGKVFGSQTQCSILIPTSIDCYLIGSAAVLWTVNGHIIALLTSDPWFCAFRTHIFVWGFSNGQIYKRRGYFFYHSSCFVLFIWFLVPLIIFRWRIEISSLTNYFSSSILILTI